MGKEPRNRTLAGSFLAVLIGLVLFAAIAEGALRLGFPHWREFHSGRFIQPVAVPGYQPVLVGVPHFDGWFAQNNGDFRIHLKLNGHGLRNPEPLSAANGRVWVIGDSMTFGWGVGRDEMYSSVAASLSDLPTYNLASPGTDVCGYQSLVARMPRGVRPTAVVLGIVIENDLKIYDCAGASPKPAGEAAPSYSLPTMLDVKRWLTAHSALYNTVVVSLKRVPALIGALIKLGLVEQPQGYSPPNDRSELSRIASETAVEIDRLRGMLAPDIAFAVLIVPARFEIRDGDPLLAAQRNLLRAELDRRHIPYIDPIEQFRQAGFEATHFAHDGHWSAHGHRIAGEAVAPWLKQTLAPN